MKKNLIVSLVILSICLTIFYGFFFYMNRGCEEQQYEIDYAILSELFDYYDSIDDNWFNMLQYQCCKKKIINSFFDKEESRDKENYALIYSLNNIKSYRDVRRFVDSIGLKLMWLLSIHDDEQYTKDMDRFFITVKRSNLTQRSEVFLYVDCNGKKSESVQLIK